MFTVRDQEKLDVDVLVRGLPTSSAGWGARVEVKVASVFGWGYVSGHGHDHNCVQGQDYITRLHLTLVCCMVMVTITIACRGRISGGARVDLSIARLRVGLCHYTHIWSYGHVLYPCMSGGARVGPSRGAGVGLCHYVSVIPIYGHMTMCYTHILAGLDPREGQV